MTSEARFSATVGGDPLGKITHTFPSTQEYWEPSRYVLAPPTASCALETLEVLSVSQFTHLYNEMVGQDLLMQPEFFAVPRVSSQE